jgi:hypothetical protein
MNERRDWRIFGRIASTGGILLYVAMFALLVLLVVLGTVWFTQHFSIETGHHGTCPTSEIPKEVREDGVTKCVVGSPIYMNTNIGTLQNGYKTDSLIAAQDRTNDDKGTISKGCGCGRCFTKVDYSGNILSAHGNETYCNLGGHTIGVETRPHSGTWNWKGVWNQHPQ